MCKTMMRMKQSKAKTEHVRYAKRNKKKSFWFFSFLCIVCTHPLNADADIMRIFKRLEVFPSASTIVSRLLLQQTKSAISILCAYQNAFAERTLRNRFEHLEIIGVFVEAEMYLLSSLSFRLHTNPQNQSFHTHMLPKCIDSAPPDLMNPLFRGVFLIKFYIILHTKYEWIICKHANTQTHSVCTPVNLPISSVIRITCSSYCFLVVKLYLECGTHLHPQNYYGNHAYQFVRLNCECASVCVSVLHFHFISIEFEKNRLDEQSAFKPW